MAQAITILTAMAAFLFSLGLAALLEELFLGGLFRCFFAPRPDLSQKSKSRGKAQGELKC